MVIALSQTRATRAGDFVRPTKGSGRCGVRQLARERVGYVGKQVYDARVIEVCDELPQRARDGMGHTGGDIFKLGNRQTR